MASSALEAKINKIRQQNEEIRRRYEEVEEDKKNAAKLNALVQMVPSTDWPERKEPPEFSNPPRAKQKLVKEKPDYSQQGHGEGKKTHTFAQGEGPPPDPKYNFLADSEREETVVEHTRENTGNRNYNKVSRGNFRKKITGREGIPKDNKFYKGNHRDEYQPGYEAWRAERNRIDEDRISRQRTAEGNWRREWDNDKIHIVDDVMKASNRASLGDFTKKDHKDFDRKYHINGNDHINHNRGNQRPHRGTSKSFHNYENRSHNTYDQHRHNLPGKVPLSPTTSDERTVVATDKSIKVTLNQGNITKGPVMSVKVNSPSIAGTGRVGPRQRTRVTYSHSDAEVTMPETESFSRQKSFEDKSKGAYFNNQRSPNIKRSHSQKKKDPASRSPYLQRRETKGEENSQKYYDNDFKSGYQQNRDQPKPYSTSKSPRTVKKFVKLRYDAPNAHSDKKENDQATVEGGEVANVKENNSDTQDVERQIPENSLDIDVQRIEPNDAKTDENSSEVSKETVEMEKCITSSEEINAKTENVTIVEQKTNDEAITAEDTSNTETTETVDTPSASTDNTENITKDFGSNEIKTDKNEESKKDDVNTLKEDHQVKCDLPVVDSDFNQVQLQGAGSNESNNSKSDINKLENDITRKDDQQHDELSNEASEPSLNDNCDTIKGEATEKQQGPDTKVENLAGSSDAETPTVIETTERSVNSDEVAESKQVEITNNESKEVDMNDNNKNTEDAGNHCEMQLEGTKSNETLDNSSLDNKVESQINNAVDNENKENVEDSKE